MQGRKSRPIVRNARILGVDESLQFARTAHITSFQRTPLGFPATVIGDDAEESLTLHTLLARRPATSLLVEMADDALVDSGIYAGDVLVVDSATHPHYGAVALVALDGALLVRHYCPDSAALHLLPAHAAFSPVSLPAQERIRRPHACQIRGVVTAVIHRLRLVRSA